MTKNQKQILIVLGVLLGAGGISFFYWRSIPRRLEVKLTPQNRKAIEEAELE